MKLESFRYTSKTGWTAPFPDLDSPRTIVFVFGAPSYRDDASPLEELATHFANSIVVGCSTAGEVLRDELTDNSLSVAVAKFERTELRRADAPVNNADESFGAGRNIAEALQAGDLAGVFVLSEGLNVNGSELVRGLNDVLPESVVVTGGLAGDNERFQHTWVLHNGRPTPNFVSAVGFYGEHVRIGHGSKGGWDLFGPERTVTRSQANVLYELDGKPALDLYKSYLGDLAEGLPATGLLFPLALRSSEDDEQKLVRTLLAVDEEEQSMTFAGDVPQGSLVQLMKANMDRLVEGASDAALMTRGNGAAQELSGHATLCIAISCVGRRLVLGARTEDELESTLDILPDNAHQVGFYSYGEISPYTTGHCDLHNQTMTLTTIAEV